MSRRVLLVRLDNAGDVLLTGPAVRAVAASARVHYLCGPRGVEAARLLPGVDEVTVHRAGWIDPDPGPVHRDELLGLVASIAAIAPSEAVVFTSHHQSALPMAMLLRLAGVAPVAAVSDDYAGSLLDVRHRPAADLHEVERDLSLVARLGYVLPSTDDGRLAVTLPGETRDAPGDYVGGGRDVEGSYVEGGYVVVHPGASVPARAWAPQDNAALVSLLARRGERVVVTGGGAERDLTAFVAAGAGARGSGYVVDLGGRTDLAGLARVLAGARAVVAGNTGPAHLAAAVGTPVVSLYAPTVPASRWAPWRVPHVLLGRQDISCAGCRARRCPRAGHPCLDVSAEEVLAALDGLTPRRDLTWAAAG